MPLAYYFGMLPDILEIQSKTFRIAYKVYVALVYLLATFCHLSQLIKLYQILTDENFIFDELIRNYIITSYHFTALIKCLFLRGTYICCFQFLKNNYILESHSAVLK